MIKIIFLAHKSKQVSKITLFEFHFNQKFVVHEKTLVRESKLKVQKGQTKMIYADGDCKPGYCEEITAKTLDHLKGWEKFALECLGRPFCECISLSHTHGSKHMIADVATDSNSSTI